MRVVVEIVRKVMVKSSLSVSLTTLKEVNVSKNVRVLLMMFVKVLRVELVV